MQQSKKQSHKKIQRCAEKATDQFPHHFYHLYRSGVNNKYPANDCMNSLRTSILRTMSFNGHS